MICVDSSALLAILLNEPQADACQMALVSDDDPIISAATVAEALIVAERRRLKAEMLALLQRVPFRVVDVTWQSALAAAEAHGRWGKGRHRAQLNYGDCFAYELASRYGCPLLYVGDDFAKTDVARAV